MEKKCKTEKEKGRRRPRGLDLLGPRLPASLSARARGPASRPSRPLMPAHLSAPPAFAATLAPCVSRALPTRALISFARSRCQRTPPVSATVHLLHAHAESLLRQNADNGGRAGQGVMPGAWTCLPLGAAPTQPLVTIGCKQAPRLPLIPVRRSPSSMAELGYKGHGPRSPSARSVARRHLDGHPLRTQT